MSNSVRPHRQQPTRLPCPWDSPGKNTGIGCHFLLQCRKMKSESEVNQSCLTLSDPMDCSLPGSSIHGISKQEFWSGVPLPTLVEMLVLPFIGKCVMLPVLSRAWSKKNKKGYLARLCWSHLWPVRPDGVKHLFQVEVYRASFRLTVQTLMWLENLTSSDSYSPLEKYL